MSTRMVLSYGPLGASEVVDGFTIQLGGEPTWLSRHDPDGEVIGQESPVLLTLFFMQ